MAADASEIEKLYEYGGRLSEAKDKSAHVSDYREIINAAKGSAKAKQLAAQLIPRFVKCFPNLATEAITAHFDLCEDEESAVRIQAIRGFPLLCKEMSSEYIYKIVFYVGQLLTTEENVERDAVHKTLMSIIRQDVKESLTALFKHIVEGDENVREKVLGFLKDRVFPLKTELLKPQVEMERHVTDLVKKSLQDVTGAEFKMFMDFLKSLSIFGEGASQESVEELLGIIEGQADLNAHFKVSDLDHIDRLNSCMFMALPFFRRGVSNSKFLNYLYKHIFPVFDELPEERRLNLLKNLAESAPYTTPQDSRQLLPSVVQLLKNYMPRRKNEDIKYNYVECLLYTFHHLAHKTPNATNSLCGYKVVTGQPSDRLGEDFSEIYKDFTERLNNVEEHSKSTMKKLTQGMAELNKSMASAKTDDEKSNIKTKKLNTTTGLRTCNNILAMTQPLHAKAPSFIGDSKVNLSWKEAVKPSPLAAAAGGKRTTTTTNGSGAAVVPNKRGRGEFGVQNQLMNRALEGLSRGAGVRSGGPAGGRGRGWGGRGQGRGYR